MSSASSNLARLRVIKETTFGTTPTTGTSKDLRFTGESLNFAIQTETSAEIRADRQIADLVQVGAETSGDVNIELSYGSFDDLIASALGGEWVSDVLKNGTKVDTYSLEQGFTDINQFITYKGMAVSGMSLEFAVNAILTGSFSFMGREAVRSGASVVPAAGPQETTEVMNSAVNFKNLEVDGVAYPCGVSSISLAVEGGLRAVQGLGNLGACEINPGTFAITADVVVYFKDGTIYDKYIANSHFSLEWEVEDAAGNKYKFELPKVKITQSSVNAGQLDEDVELTLTVQALYDTTANSSIVITRTPAVVGP